MLILIEVLGMMSQKAYVIYANWGEYDDYTKATMFVCPMQMEAELFVEAFYNREKPYWEKVEEFFLRRMNGINLDDLSNMDPERAADLRKYCVPQDIGFGYDELDILTLIQHHPNT
jgi:hypothetical protein